VDPKTAVLLAILGVLWFFLLFLTFRPSDPPKLPRLFFFQIFLVVTLVLGYLFLIKVYKWNPNPARVRLARFLTDDKTIYLGDFVPGLFDLNYIRRIDTDGKEEDIKEEWFAFYRYDVHTNPESQARAGPYGAAIYDYNDCRPPAIFSFELVPVSYDYLGQDAADVQVENIIPYNDPLSGGQDRPEVIVLGSTSGVVTDLNIFRKQGVELDCFQMQEWRATHPGEAFPLTLRYANIGSFRANYRIDRNAATITTVDRSPFERSQITIRRDYRPQEGSYFHLNTQVLLDPVEYTLAFGPGQPDNIPQVYYPEKAVLAFYRNLGQDETKLGEAESYLCPDARQIFDIETDQFGIAMPRRDLVRTLIWEIRYRPDIEAEQLHETREVTVVVVGVDKDGNIDRDNPCEITWEVVGLKNPRALPYGCEWCLAGYRSTCVPGK